MDLYAGRYIDSNTGRIRVIPKASMKAVDPTNFDQVMGYKKAAILNKWN